MANFFDKLTIEWLYDRDQIRSITNILNRLADPKSYVYAGLKETIIGGTFNDTLETVTITGGSGGDTGTDGIFDGGRRFGTDGLFSGGRRFS